MFVIVVVVFVAISKNVKRKQLAISRCYYLSLSCSLFRPDLQCRSVCVCCYFQHFPHLFRNEMSRLKSVNRSLFLIQLTRSYLFSTFSSKTVVLKWYPLLKGARIMAWHSMEWQWRIILGALDKTKARKRATLRHGIYFCLHFSLLSFGNATMSTSWLEVELRTHFT